MGNRGGLGARTQAGLSMIGFLMVAILAAAGVLVGFKLMPAYIEYYSLKNVLKTIVNDPDMRDAPVAEVKRSFERRSLMADVKVVTASDLEISKQGGALTIGTSYSVKVPLAGNVSACLDFEAVAQK
ncbi:MAG TPA: DUF4845 domain-containing protein [Burkholderiales bacterium]